MGNILVEHASSDADSVSSVDSTEHDVRLYGVNKFLASGRPTNSDWGRAPARLAREIERQVLDKDRIRGLLELFKGQPWVKTSCCAGAISDSAAADRFQADCGRAAAFAIRNSKHTKFMVEMNGQRVVNFLAIGPQRTVLVCWEGSWTSRYGTVQHETMYQIVVPYLEGLSKSDVLRAFLNKFDNVTNRRVGLRDWSPKDSVLFRQSCKAIWNMFPDIALDGEQRLGTLAEETTCTICLEDLEEGKPYQVLCSEDDHNPANAIKTACGHYFHTECIGQWLANKNQCPVCRSNPWSMTC